MHICKICSATPGMDWTRDLLVARIVPPHFFDIELNFDSPSHGFELKIEPQPRARASGTIRISLCYDDARIKIKYTRFRDNFGRWLDWPSTFACREFSPYHNGLNTPPGIPRTSPEPTRPPPRTLRHIPPDLTGNRWAVGVLRCFSPKVDQKKYIFSPRRKLG